MGASIEKAAQAEMRAASWLYRGLCWIAPLIRL